MKDKLKELAIKYNTKIIATYHNRKNTIISYSVESESGMGVIVELDKEIDSFMDGFGSERIGSGSGFGYRDLEYQNRSKSKS